MWATFVIAVVACAAFLFVPGYLVLRAFGAIVAPRWAALACAPIPSMACYALLCAAYGFAGVFCTWTVVALPVIAAAFVCFALGRFAARLRSPEPFDFRKAAVALLYVVLGVVVAVYVFTGRLASPDAFVQSWDNVHHLDTVRGFLDSGYWSSLNTSLYLGEDAVIDPFDEGSFYPSAWHALVALVASATQVPITLAVNAVNFTVLAIVFPVGVFGFLQAVFGDDRLPVACGALFVAANAANPWTMLTWGPLYPNVMAHCLVPAFSAAFVGLIAHGIARNVRAGAVAVMAAGVVAFAFIQPNGLFTALVLLCPYFVVRVYQTTARRWAAARAGSSGAAAGVVAACVAALAVAAFWFAAFKAPFMQAVVKYRWPCDTSLLNALLDVATQRLHVEGLALGCAVLLACGIVAAFVRGRHRWLVASWVLASAVYVVCVSVDGFWHQLAAGFWYTDIPRVAAVAALAAVPLQAAGLAEVVSLVSHRTAQRAKGGRMAAGAAVVVLVAALVFVPFPRTESHKVGERWFGNGSTLAMEAGRIDGDYSFASPRVYDERERAFVRKALEVMPPGSIAVNEPNDGSAYAYGVDGLRTYYRYWTGYGKKDEGEKPQSALIRGRLNCLATDALVQRAVKKANVSYVLQLEQGERSWETTMWTYGNGTYWRGIDAIDEETAGFELVLAQDDMRLYKILV